MKYKLKANDFAKRRAQISAHSSLESYLGNKSSSSATEGLDEAAIQSIAADKMKEFLVNELVELLTDGKIFFSKDASQAYDELVGMLADEDVRADVVQIIANNNAKTYLDEWDEPTEEDIERDKAQVRYTQAALRLEGLESEVKARRKYLDKLRDALNEQYPGLIITIKETSDEE